MKKTLCLLAAVICLVGMGPHMVFGVTTVDLNIKTPEELAQSLVGDGVVVSNVSFLGAPVAGGVFWGGTSDGIGIEKGIILSSGKISDAVGPNTSDGTSTSNGQPGDADLTGLVSKSTYDAAVLEFDFTPAYGKVSFEYVFGSEEYNEYVGSFNDVFAFYLDGVNIALIPGTTTCVSIDNVNKDKNPACFHNNDPSELGQPTPFYTQFDGFTTVLTAEAVVTPGVPHHIKLAVADTGDSAVDSAVFIKGGSFTSSPLGLAIDDGLAGETVFPGAAITYQLCYDNLVNPEPATGVTLVDTVPDTTTFVSATGNGIYDASAKTVAWNIGTLNAGAAPQCVTMTVQVDPAAPDGTVIKNQASIDSNETPATTKEKQTVVDLKYSPILQNVAISPACRGSHVQFAFAVQCKKGDLQNYKVILKVPESFVFNGFDAYGGNAQVGMWNVDFSSVPDVSRDIRGIDKDKAYVDLDENGSYTASVDPLIVHTIGSHVFTMTLPFGGDPSSIIHKEDSITTLTCYAKVMTNLAAAGGHDICADFVSVDPDTGGDTDGVPPGPASVPTQCKTVQVTQAIYVASGGAGNGSSWQNALGSIQGGIDAADAGNEVYVAMGVYPETVVLKPGVEVYGGFEGTETVKEQRNWDINVSKIDASSLSPPTHVVTGADGATLDGFTITGGKADGAASPDNQGGGMINANVSVRVENCTFTGNSASGNGGAVWNGGGAPDMVNCAFTGNISTGGTGGAVENYQSTATLVNCTFSLNQAQWGGGAVSNNNCGSGATLSNCTFAENGVIDGDGGGVINWNKSASVVLSNNKFMNNKALNGCGGAIHVTADSGSMVIRNNMVQNNAALEGGGIYCGETSSLITLIKNLVYGNVAEYGGGIYCACHLPQIENNVIRHNEAKGAADSAGGGIYFHDTKAELFNNTIVGNSANGKGGGVYAVDGEVVIINAILYANNAPGGPQGYADSILSIDYSDVDGGPVGLGGAGVAYGSHNLAQNADFKDPANFDYHLNSTSPCVDKGISQGFPAEDKESIPRPQGKGSDMGAYEYYDSNTSSSNQKGGVTQSCYSLCSKSVFNPDDDLFKLLTAGTNLGPHDAAIWRAFVWGGNAQGFVEIDQSGMPEAKFDHLMKGFLLISKYDKELQFYGIPASLDTGGATPNYDVTHRDYRIVLNQGWNVIGAPFFGTIDWSDIFNYHRNIGKFGSSGENASVSILILGPSYNGTSWDTPNPMQMKGDEGYWVYCWKTGGDTIYIPEPGGGFASVNLCAVKGFDFDAAKANTPPPPAPPGFAAAGSTLALIYPSAGQMVAYGSTGGKAMFSFSPVEGAKAYRLDLNLSDIFGGPAVQFHVQLIPDQTPGFSVKPDIATYAITLDMKTWNLLSIYDITWSVLALDKTDASANSIAGSAPGKFRLAGAGSLTQIFPAAGDDVVIPYGKPYRFCWEDYPGADNYVLFLARLDGTSVAPLIVKEGLRKTCFTAGAPGETSPLAAGVWFWTVLATDAGGKVLTPNFTIFSFEVQ